ncbi:hypothetical protein ACFXBB_06230 [Streptomyces scopuliridis]|uniref:hypothetical protein n=1 Tax=Streptomyces scopuliridis TaxID=452529 RepID=UPI00368B76F2
MTATAGLLVPHITAREGKELGSSRNLGVLPNLGGLRYLNEFPPDRDINGVLWARCSQVLGPDRLPTGRPLWRKVHPTRQRETMLKLRCQVCAGPTKTDTG